MNQLQNKKRGALYRAASLSAYNNCLRLLEEANLLQKHSRYARAYALCELSLEEFAKAFLYRCYSAGLIKDADFHRDLNLHEEKLFHAIHLMSTAALVSPLVEALDDDTGVYNHSQHILPEKIREVAESRRMIRIFDVLKDAHKRKLDGLYVGVEPRKGTIHSPDDLSWEDQANQLLDFVNTYANGFEVILNADDSRFIKDVALLDPQILSGTMKSDWKEFADRAHAVRSREGRNRF